MNNQPMMSSMPGTIPSAMGFNLNQGPNPEACSLFVGNLHHAVTDQVLYEHFAPHGNLQSCSVKRNHFTSESRGFGFVNYSDQKSADSGREKMNHGIIMGRELRICKKRNLSSLNQEANLYVKNLAESVTGKVIEEEFIRFGDIFCCSVRYDENNKHLGYGYVQFEKPEDANKAMEDMNEKELDGKKIVVQKFLPKTKRKTNSWRTNLFLKNFPQGWTQEQVEEFITTKLGSFGKITSTCVKFIEKYNNHIAFVCFETQEQATEAHKELTDYEVENTTIDINFHQKKNLRKKQLAEKFAKATNDTNLIIKSIKIDVTEEALRAAFSKFGEITSMKILKANKVPKIFADKNIELQYAFVNYGDSKDATKALTDGKTDADVKALIHDMHDARKDFICFQQPKAVRQQFLRMQRKNMLSSLLLQQQFMMMQTMMGGNRGGRKGNKQPQMAPGMPMMPPMMMMGGMGPAAMKKGGMPMMMNPAMQMQMGMAGMNPMMPPMGGLNQNAPAAAENSGEEKNIGWLKTNMREFEALQPMEKRKILGNLMYYRIGNVQGIAPDLVPKITGMLIDLDVLELNDIIMILENEDSLNDRVKDAIAIIREGESAN